ncbi:hypothetical protein SLS62_000421 [Diatrype stigma]|uniref:Uncharacterized protein n=1 Tax=Diatrype stigma TaxID=117547 RepID=A0AAN9VA78_9PEZI
MARVRKHIPKKTSQAATARRVDRVPLLASVIPKAGFQWKSAQGSSFLANELCRQVVKALRAFVDVKCAKRVTKQLTGMFEVACETVRAGNIPDDPAHFWVKVAEDVPWMKAVDGENLQSFAMKVLSARVTAMNAVEEVEELGLDSRAEELKAKTELTDAVDRYTKLLPIKYSFWRDLDPSPVDLIQMGRGAVLPASYLDWWVEDPHNQGSAAETLAYKELLGEAGSLGLGKMTPGLEKYKKEKEKEKEMEKKKIDEAKDEAGDVDMDRQEEGDDGYDGYDEYDEYHYEDSEDSDYLDKDGENKWLD